MPVEICEANKNLYVIYWLKFRPFLDNVNFFLIYPDTIYRNNKA